MTALRQLDQQMTIAEFLAFTASRPDEERWELIEGVPRMNASPTNWHQKIAGNIFFVLESFAIANNATWIPLMGIGTQVPASPDSLPQPDLHVLEGPLGVQSTMTSESLVLFEVLSKSNTRLDQAWRKKVYASIPNLQHYVTVSQKTAHVIRHDRVDSWIAHEAKGLAAKLDLPALGKAVSVPLQRMYRGTPVR